VYTRFVVDFLFVVDILWNYDRSNAWFQESSDSKLIIMAWRHMYFHELWLLLFPQFADTT